MTALLAASFVLRMEGPTWELVSGSRRIDKAPKPLSRRGSCFLGVRSGCVVSHRPKIFNRRRCAEELDLAEEVLNGLRIY